jgi:hypothetical protein
MPHQDLGRDEAMDLMRKVFEAQLEAPLGVFHDLEVKKFLSPDVAVVAATSPPALSAEAESGSPNGDEGLEGAPSLKEQLRAQTDLADQSPGEDRSSPSTGNEGHLVGNALLDSTLPLQAEAPSGEMEPVDLSLEREGDELQPVNPLTEVGIPHELGEGIELHGPGITIELAGAPDGRRPSIIGDSVAFLPNVAEDTDLALVPSPTGLETFTQLRSGDSPLSQTFELGLPSGASLQSTEDGGAAVLREDGEVLASVSAPNAIDATGADVPVGLEVSGSTFSLVVAPGGPVEFPILVDPLIQTYEWAKSNYWQSGICNSSFDSTTSNPCMNRKSGAMNTERKAGRGISKPTIAPTAHGFQCPPEPPAWQLSPLANSGPTTGQRLSTPYRATSLTKKNLEFDQRVLSRK